VYMLLFVRYEVERYFKLLSELPHLISMLFYHIAIVVGQIV